METKLVQNKGREILEKCGFLNGWEFLREGLSGGLLLGWQQNVNLSIQYGSKHLIHANLLDHKGTPLSVTFIYGQLDHTKREAFWLELKPIAKPIWLCIRDFNQVLCHEDKFSCNTLNDLELCELEAKGQRFTWINRREDEAFVMEKLDRAFASVEWINIYPHYALYNHPILRSDHGSILLDFAMQQPFRRRPFRFERMWLTHSICKDMIQKAREVQSKGSRAFKLQHNLNNVRKRAIEWNRTIFGKIKKELKEKQQDLQEIQDNIQTMADVRKERQLREEIEMLMFREEIMWAQKARNEWILKGDRNTKYFQTLVKQRRARSQNSTS